MVIGDSRIADEDFARKKARALLKLLALQPARRLQRDQVIEWLWPGLDAQAASGQLYKAVHHVRRALDRAAPGSRDFLIFKEGVLRLEATGGIKTDVDEFEEIADDALRTQDHGRLLRAVEAYTGDLLPEDLYEEWTLAQRDDLRERFLDVLTALGNRQLETGYVADAADSFRRVLERDNAREAAQRGLMKTYALEGRTDRAAHQYQQCERVLRRELGVNPSRETVELHERIQGGQFERSAVRHSGARGRPDSTSPLVGREPQLASAMAVIERLDQGRGGAVTIEGEAGIGKTRLVAQVMHTAGLRGWQVLYGGGEKLEGRVPFGPFIEAVRSGLRDGAEAADLPAELSAAIPEVRKSAEIKIADGVAARTALFAGALRFLAARAGAGPLVLVLEDLHWADDGTMRLFHYLARSVWELPLILIGSLRLDEPDEPPGMDEILTDLSARGLLRRIFLGPLSRSEHESLLGHSLGSEIEPRVIDELFELCEGNPLFTNEVVNHLVESGRLRRTHNGWRSAQPKRPVSPLEAVPSSLRALLRQRLARLSVEARLIADLAAVSGTKVVFDDLRTEAVRGLGIAEPRFLDLVDEILSAKLLVESGFDFLFRHTLFREGLLEQMSRARRRSLHELMARALEERPGPRPVEALARHYSESGEIVKAVECLIEAGDGAQAVYDHDDALRRYEEAARLARDHHVAFDLLAELCERMGDVHRAVGRVDAALTSYKDALGLIDSMQSPPERRAGIHRKIVLASILAPDIATAVTHLGLAREATASDPMEEARHLILQSLVDWHMNMLEEAVEHAERALRIAEEKGAATEITQACEMLALAHFPLGNWEEGLRYELRRTTREWSPDIVVAVDGHLCLWDARVHGDEPRERAERFIERTAEQSQAQGNLRCLAVCHYALGMIHSLAGHLDTADDHLVRSLELHEEVDSVAGMAYVLARRINVMTALGRLTDGASLIERGLDLADDTAVKDHALMLTLAAAMRNRLEAGDRNRADELLRDAQDLDRKARPCPVCSAEMLPAMAATMLARDKPREAWEYAERAEEIAKMGNNMIGAARARDVQGRVHRLRESNEAAARCFSEAAASFRALGQRHELLRTLVAWGELPGADEPRAEAKELLAGKDLGRPSS